MEDKKNTLGKYTNAPDSPKGKMEQAAQIVKNDTLEDYEAMVEAKRGRLPRFEMVDEDGESYICPYAHLLPHARFIPSTLLTIPTTTDVIIIEGKNLKRIKESFLEERIRTLNTFNPKQHNPPEEGEPIIGH